MRAEKNKLDEPIGPRQVYQLAWPIMVGMLSYTVMSVADTIFVGWLGTVPLAGIGIGVVTVFLVGGFPIGLLSGVRVNVAQRTGSEDHGRALRTGVTGVWMAVGLGLIAAATAPFGEWLFLLSGADADVAAQGQAYFGIRVLASPFAFANFALAGLFQGRGDTRTPMVATVTANVVNVVLDPIFIFGLGPIPALGLHGAALTTAFGSICCTLVLLVRARTLLRGVSLLPVRALGADVWNLGSAMGVERFIDVASWMVFTGVLVGVGDEHIAAHVVAVRIIGVSFLPGFAIGEATGVLVGQAVGARRMDRAAEAHRSGLIVATTMMAAWAVVFVVVPDPLIAVFKPEPEVAEIARDLLLIAAVFQVLDAFATVSYSALQGAGDSRFVMGVVVCSAWLVKLPIGMGLALHLGMGAVGAWLGLTGEIALIAVVCMARARILWGAKAVSAVSTAA